MPLPRISLGDSSVLSSVGEWRGVVDDGRRCTEDERSNLMIIGSFSSVSHRGSADLVSGGSGPSR